MNGSGPDRLGAGFSAFQPGAAWKGLRAVIYLLVVLSLTGCGAFQNLTPQVNSAQQTAISAQLTVLAATNSSAAAPQVTQAVVAPQVTQPVQAPVQPTYTALPTYTPAPTFTPQPTYTPYPTFTSPPMTIPTVAVVYAPTQASYVPAAGHPYTLRVWNNYPHTYWIGTTMPYGGNFIKPRFYVEFYPGAVTWMRIFYCRYTNYFYDNYNNDAWWYNEHSMNHDNDWDNQRWWNIQNGLYGCGHIDVYVDQPLVEVSLP